MTDEEAQEYIHKNFYKVRQKEIYIRKSLVNHIALTDEIKVKHWCEILNVPFIREQIDSCLRSKYPVFGRYMAKINLMSFRYYTYEDTDEWEKQYILQQQYLKEIEEKRDD